eukprot:gene7122-7336_t
MAGAYTPSPAAYGATDLWGTPMVEDVISQMLSRLVTRVALHVVLQELRAGAADFAGALGLKARASAILAAARASHSENFQISKRAATAVVCDLLSNDIIFSKLPPEQRLPKLLARSQIGSMEAVAAALSQPYSARHHWEVCANCGLPAETLAELGLNRRLLKCQYCVTCVCINCYREKTAATAGAGVVAAAIYCMACQLRGVLRMDTTGRLLDKGPVAATGAD